ncbi:unnamed protein product [Dicrocoelium dendriticum]|nr:unnamed protein product [Dicrocoelium dendriticum]
MEDSQPSPTSSTSGSRSPTSSTSSLHPRQFALIVASVGDSQAFLLSKFHGIRELTGWMPRSTASPDSCTFPEDKTKASSPLPSSPPARDFRDCGGALGSVYADNSPELNNLICAVLLNGVTVKQGCIIQGCVLGDQVTTESDCHLKSCAVAALQRVPAGTVLESEQLGFTDPELEVTQA